MNAILKSFVVLIMMISPLAAFGKAVTPSADVIFGVKQKNNKAADLSDLSYEKTFVSLSMGPDKKGELGSTNRQWIEAMSVSDLRKLEVDAKAVVALETSAIDDLDSLSGRDDVNAEGLSSARQGLVELRRSAEANLAVVQKTIKARAEAARR